MTRFVAMISFAAFLTGLVCVGVDTARTAALAVLSRDGHPVTARIALATGPGGGPVSLVSQLSHHTRALARDPRASLLVGDPGSKGDPLTHPRLTLQATARLVPRDDPGFADMQTGWLARHPKSKLYIGFGDFLFARFDVSAAFLNGGFGKAYQLTPADLGLTP